MTTQVHPAIVPFSEHVEVFRQTLTVTGRAEVSSSDSGWDIGAVWFDSITVAGFSEELKEVVFAMPVDIKSLSHKQLLELEIALGDQCADSIFETLANRD